MNPSGAIKFALASALLTILHLSLSASEPSVARWKELRDQARAAAQSNLYDEALASYKAAFAEAEAVFKPNDFGLLDTALETGLLNVQLNRPKDAVVYFEKALTGLEKTRGGEHIYKATFLTLLGQANLYARNLTEAETWFLAARDFSRERFGPRHPLVAESLSGLATVHIEKQEPDQALNLLNEALTIAKNSSPGRYKVRFDWHRPNVSTEGGIQNTIGILHSSRSNYTAAEKSFRDAQKTFERHLRKTDPQLGPVMKNLGRVCQAQGKYQEAEEAFIRSLRIDQAMIGSELSFALTSRYLADLHYEQNDRALKPFFARFLSGKSKEPDPGDFFKCVDYMARYYAETNWTRAEALIDAAVAQYKTSPEKSLPPQLRFLLAAAGISREHNQLSAAEKYLNQCINLCTPDGSSPGADAIEPLRLLTDLHVASKQFEKAEQASERQLKIAREIYEPKDTRLANILDDRAGVLEAAGKTGAAAKAREEANKIRIASALN